MLFWFMFRILNGSNKLDVKRNWVTVYIGNKLSLSLTNHTTVKLAENHKFEIRTYGVTIGADEGEAARDQDLRQADESETARDQDLRQTGTFVELTK